MSSSKVVYESKYKSTVNARWVHSIFSFLMGAKVIRTLSYDTGLSLKPEHPDKPLVPNEMLNFGVMADVR